MENSTALDSFCVFCLGPVPLGLDRCRHCGVHGLQAPCPSQVYRDRAPEPEAAASESSADLLENTTAFSSSCVFCLGHVSSGLDRCRSCGSQGYRRKLHCLPAPCPSQVYRDAVPEPDGDDTEMERLLDLVYHHVAAHGEGVSLAGLCEETGLDTTVARATVDQLEAMGFMQWCGPARVKLTDLDEG